MVTYNRGYNSSCYFCSENMIMLTSTPFNKYNAQEANNAPRLLVVDSDVSVVEMIRENFAEDGFMVDVCTSGDDTFNLDLTEYGVVLLDLAIDNNTGLNYVEQIKQIYDPSEVAVIAYSAQMSPQTIIRALNSGADDYLIKPFSIREMKARVHSVLRRR